MMRNADMPSLAVPIDADNTSARHAEAIFEEIVKPGEANVRRIYGDFSGARLKSWNGAIRSLATTLLAAALALVVLASTPALAAEKLRIATTGG